jgi:hypothetical protein
MISIPLETLNEQDLQLLELQTEYHKVCNQIVPTAVEYRCWNRVALHHLAYTKIRKDFFAGFSNGLQRHLFRLQGL